MQIKSHQDHLDALNTAKAIGAEIDGLQEVLRHDPAPQGMYRDSIINSIGEKTYSMETIARAVQEYEAVVEWEKSQADNPSVAAVRAGPRGYLPPRDTPPR